MSSEHEEGEVISPIFLIDKRDGGKRLILNLKTLNEYIEYHHFKMHGITHILKLVTQNCYMAVLDIKDAYYSVPIHPEFRKYLKFRWNGSLFQFCVFPNGLSPAPRNFTKLTKPVMSALRELGHIISIYIDDMYLQGSDFNRCSVNVIDTTSSLVSLGFYPHPEKSSIVPSQEVQILGFTINSTTMLISLTPSKRDNLLADITGLCARDKFPIRVLAALIGKLVAAFPAVQYGPLYYRKLEENKQLSLARSSGKYDAFTILTKEAREELQWWTRNLPSAHAPIIIASPTIEIFTDASNVGWGASFGPTETRGSWSIAELLLHINVKEMLAVYFGLKSLATNVRDTNIRLNIDNTATVSILKHMGTSHNNDLNTYAKKIWLWAKSRGIWLFPVYIASGDNIADQPSRNIYVDAEWQLNPSIFSKVISTLQFYPDIDLFASRLNTQLSKYISYHPDPHAFATDAFSLSWSDKRFYCFPPFSCISQCLQKITADRATGIIVVPKWPTQPFYSLINPLLIAPPVIIVNKLTNLIMPNQPTLTSAISGKTTFLACLVSGKP